MDKNSQINNSGIVGGLFFTTAIPTIYTIFRFFGSIGSVKRNAKNWGLGLVTMLLFISSIIAIVYGISSIIIDIEVTTVSGGLNNYVNVFKDISISDSAKNAITFGFVALIISWILSIITGLSVKKYLDSEESSSLSTEERFKIAKYAAIFLYSIPFYFLIKVIITYGDIKEVDSSTANFNIIALVFCVIAWLLAYSINPLLIFVTWILCIVAGVKENTLFEGKLK